MITSDPIGGRDNDGDGSDIRRGPLNVGNIFGDHRRSVQLILSACLCRNFKLGHVDDAVHPRLARGARDLSSGCHVEVAAKGVGNSSYYLWCYCEFLKLEIPNGQKIDTRGSGVPPIFECQIASYDKRPSGERFENLSLRSVQIRAHACVRI